MCSHDKKYISAARCPQAARGVNQEAARLVCVSATTSTVASLGAMPRNTCRNDSLPHSSHCTNDRERNPFYSLIQGSLIGSLIWQISAVQGRSTAICALGAALPPPNVCKAPCRPVRAAPRRPAAGLRWSCPDTRRSLCCAQLHTRSCRHVLGCDIRFASQSNGIDERLGG